MEKIELSLNKIISFVILLVISIIVAVVAIYSSSEMSSIAATLLKENKKLQDSITTIYVETDRQIQRIAPEGTYKIGDLEITVEEENTHRHLSSNIWYITDK